MSKYTPGQAAITTLKALGYTYVAGSDTWTLPAKTPAAQWREAGEPDPHGTRYDCERHQLVLGKLSDDELANGAFMNYDVRPPVERLLDGTAHSPLMWMTAVKDRIRWLSRRVEAMRGTPQSRFAEFMQKLKPRFPGVNPLSSLPPEVLYLNHIDDLIASRNEVQRWYDEAMMRSNEAGWAGVSAADTIKFQAAMLEAFKPVATVESYTNGSYSRNYKLRWTGDAQEGATLYAKSE